MLTLELLLHTRLFVCLQIAEGENQIGSVFSEYKWDETNYQPQPLKHLRLEVCAKTKSQNKRGSLESLEKIYIYERLQTS